MRGVASLTYFGVDVTTSTHATHVYLFLTSGIRTQPVSILFFNVFK